MPEQYLKEVAESAAKQAVRTYRNAALLGFLVLLLGNIFAFYALNQDRNARRAQFTHVQIPAIKAAVTINCNQNFRTIRGARGVLDLSATLISHSGQLDSSQRRQAAVFYALLKRPLVLPDCRKTAALVTTNPQEPVKPVIPLHP